MDVTCVVSYWPPVQNKSFEVEGPLLNNFQFFSKDCWNGLNRPAI
jgi:hypothetical protein